MKCIIAGGRKFKDAILLKKEVDDFRDTHDITEIVSGHALGADSLGEAYANFYGIKLTIFKADWDTYGRAAGPIRNKQMIDYADAIIVFWDGKSRGTKNDIDLAKEKGIILKIVRYIDTNE